MERIVKAEEVERLTRKGWRLVESYEVDVPSWEHTFERRGINVQGHPPRLPVDPYGEPLYGRGGDPKMDETPYFPIRTRLFRMEFDNKSWRAHLAKRQDELEEREQFVSKKSQKAENRIHEAKRAQEKAEEAVTGAQHERDMAVERAADLRDENDRLREKLRLMEEDMAKMREDS